MTVNIKDKRKLQDFPLRVCDIRDGHAYECEFGGFYIGNKYEDVAAFAIDGTAILTLDGMCSSSNRKL